MKKFHGWNIIDDCHEDTDNLDWTIEKFGSSNSAGRWFWDNGKFYFKNADDALLYTLRWSE